MSLAALQEHPDLARVVDAMAALGDSTVATFNGAFEGEPALAVVVAGMAQMSVATGSGYAYCIHRCDDAYGYGQAIAWCGPGVRGSTDSGPAEAVDELWTEILSRLGVPCAEDAT